MKPEVVVVLLTAEVDHKGRIRVIHSEIDIICANRPVCHREAKAPLTCYNYR